MGALGEVMLDLDQPFFGVVDQITVLQDGLGDVAYRRTVPGQPAPLGPCRRGLAAGVAASRPRDLLVRPATAAEQRGQTVPAVDHTLPRADAQERPELAPVRTDALRAFQSPPLEIVGAPPQPDPQPQDVGELGLPARGVRCRLPRLRSEASTRSTSGSSPAYPPDEGCR